MKNRKLLLIVSLALAMMMSLGGTLAYLTDTDADVNVMVLGNVKIEQNEYERVPKAEDSTGATSIREFTQAKTMLPAVYTSAGYQSKEELTVDGYTVEIRDQVSNYVDKIVNVTNTGASDAYVRTIFAFPEAGDFNTTYNAMSQWFHWNGVSDSDTDPDNGWKWGKTLEGRDKIMEWPGNTDNWDVVENVKIGDKVFDIYVATNKNVIKPGETTAPTLLGMFLDSAVDCEVGADGTLNYTFTVDNGETKTVYNLGDISHLEVLTLTQAVQASGFSDAWTALDAAFGDVTEANAQAWFGGMPTSNKAAEFTTAGTYNVERSIVFEDETGDNIVASAENVIVNVTGGYYDTGSQRNNCAVWAKDGGTVNIYDGTFIGDGDAEPATSASHVDLIYAGQGGTINIYGGTFSLRNNGWLLNEKDNTATITVYGGSFLNWNPADNVSEGANTNFLAEGYIVQTDTVGTDTWYHVVQDTTDNE